MAYRIAPADDGQQPAKTKPVKRKTYRDFIKTLPCIITREHGVECAHVSMKAPALGASGRGKGQKADDRWTLPLSPEMHRMQHEFVPVTLMRGKNFVKITGEEAFWRKQGINPHLACLVLWGLYCENPDTAEQRATELIMKNLLGGF